MSIGDVFLLQSSLQLSHLPKSFKDCGHLFSSENRGDFIDQSLQHLVQYGRLKRLMQLVQQGPYSLGLCIWHQSHISQPKLRVHPGPTWSSGELHLEALGCGVGGRLVWCQVDLQQCARLA